MHTEKNISTRKEISLTVEMEDNHIPFKVKHNSFSLKLSFKHSLL